MRVNAQSFFSFCAQHVPLLRDLAELSVEINEGEMFRMIRSNAAEELPETTWRRLKEFQIMVPLEPGSDLFILAQPVKELIGYLFDQANPTTPEVIQGFVQSLSVTSRQLARALESEDLSMVEVAFVEINRTLRRIYADLEATHHTILLEVAQFKTVRKGLAVRDKYRRIAHWMERFVEPMIEVIRADGQMRAVFDDVERLLGIARQRALFSDIPNLERNLRYLRLIGHHALRIFLQCRKEIQPLYESLRRSSFLAEGAAIALERLYREGIANWGAENLIGVASIRIQSVPGDTAIAKSLRRIVEHPPEPPPVLAFGGEDSAPGALVRRLWLDGLESAVRSELPLADLLGWLSRTYPERTSAELLSGFTRLLFHDEFRGKFMDEPTQIYRTADAELDAPPVSLTVR